MHQHVQRRVTLRWVALGVALFTIAGCGSSEQVGGTPSTFSPNEKAWQLPLDSYVADTAVRTFASQLLRADCEKEAGYDPPNVVDPRSYLTAVRNKALRRLFNPDLAREYGYHPGRPQVEPPAQYPVDSAPQDVQRRCQDQANERFFPVDDPMAFAQDLAWSGEEKALADPEVTDAARRWHDCMIPLGLPDLPKRLDESSFPTEWQREKFGLLRTADGERLPSWVPTTRLEIEQALFDANCRVTSGYSATYYATEVKVGQELIKKNAEKLAGGLERARALEKMATDYLSGHGASAQ